MQKGKLMRKLFSQPTAAADSPLPAANADSRPSHSQHSTFSTGTPIACLDRSPDGSRAAIAGSKVFKVIRIDGSNITEEIDLRAAITSYVSTHDSNASAADQLQIKAIKWDHGVLDTTIITACENGKISIYDLKRGGQQGFEVAKIHEHFRQVHALAVNPFKPNWLLTAGHDGTVKSFDLRGLVDGRNTAVFRGSFKCNAESVRDVAWSSTDGMQFACCTDAGAVQKWDIRKPDAPVLKITAHRSACFSIGWHPDGEHIVSGGSDQYCNVWNVSSTAERNQRPKYSFVTPAPIAHVAWRPATWSNTAQARRAAQVAIAYDESNSSRAQNSTVHIWDVARSALPFKEIDDWESAPQGIMWNSRDVLWSVDRDGNFVQTDVAFSPRVIDRRSLSTFSMSPKGSLLMLLEGRQSPRRVRNSVNSAESSPYPSHTPNTGPHLSVSRSDSEEDVVGSFLALRQKHGHRRQMSGRLTQPLSTTPPSAMTTADTKIMPLDDGVKVTGQYIPQQILALGHVPAPITTSVYSYMSRRYLSRMDRAVRVAPNKSTKDHLMSVMGHCANAADGIGHYRLAQTWRLLAFTLNLMLVRRAQYHRKSRLAIVGKEYKSNRSSPVPDSRVPERLEEVSETKKSDTPAPGSKSNSIPQNVEAESTSNVATPLVRPADNGVQRDTRSSTDVALAEPDHFSLSSTDESHSSPTPIPISSSNQSLKASSGTSGYDFYGMDFFSPQIEVGAMPKKKPLRFNYSELEGHPLHRLARHESGESFQMFSSSGDSIVGKSLTSSRHEPQSLTSEVASLRNSVANWENSLRSQGIPVPTPPATSESSDDFTTPPDTNETMLKLASSRPHKQISPPMLRLSEASAENLHVKEHPRYAGNLSDDPEIVEDDYLPWPDDPEFIISPIDPALLIQRTINFEAQTGSVNAAALVLLLRPYFPETTITKVQAVATLRQYHHRLMQQKLFTTAALLRNMCVPLYPSVFSTSQSSTSVGFFCTTCQKPLENDPLIPQSVWRCPRCLQAIDGCAVCRHRELPQDLGYDEVTRPSQVSKSNGASDPVEYDEAQQSAMWLNCPGCGHGGHAICMRAWHSASTISEGTSHSGGCCPLEGCLHPCLPGEWRDTRDEENRVAKVKEVEGQTSMRLGIGSVFESSREFPGLGAGLGVKRDPREAASSRAVEGVRLVLGGDRGRERDGQKEKRQFTLEKTRSMTFGIGV